MAKGSGKRTLSSSLGRVIAVWFSDSHLSDCIWSSRPIRGDSYFSFRQIVDLAIQHHAPLIGAGDLLDNKTNPSGPIVFLREQLQRLEQAELKIYYVQGQHERQAQPWFEVGGSTAVHIDKKTVEVNGIGYYGLDFRSSAQLAEELPKISDLADTLVCHQVWAELMGDIGHPQGSLRDIATVGWVLTGDYHKHMKINVNDRDGNPRAIFSPGSTCMQEISEEPVKHVFLLHEGGEVSSHKLLTRPVLPGVFIQHEDELGEIMGQVNHQLEQAEEESRMANIPIEVAKPLWRVSYLNTIPGLEAKLESVLKGRAHVFWKPIAGTSEEQISRAEDHLTMLDYLQDGHDSEQDTEVTDLAMRLLHCNSEDLDTELDVWVATQKEGCP